MNPNYIHTITIYNCLKKADNSKEKKDVWYKTILENCYYKNVIGRVENDKAVQMSNVYTVRVPESEKYLPYPEWVKKTEEERKEYFTFSLGDMVVKGACQEEITGEIPNTASEVLNRQKPEAFKITAFSDNTSHRCSKHYRVGG